MTKAPTTREGSRGFALVVSVVVWMKLARSRFALTMSTIPVCIVHQLVERGLLRLVR